MNFQKYFFRINKIGFAASAMAMMALTGCTTYVDRPAQGSVYVAPPVVVVPDDYVYYPTYQVYYSSRRHQYAYQEGGAWVSRPAPRGVSVNVLVASPSVRMNFHDAPASHHAMVIQQYPKNWRPPGQNQGQKENHNDDQHGSNGR